MSFGRWNRWSHHGRGWNDSWERLNEWSNLNSSEPVSSEDEALWSWKLVSQARTRGDGRQPGTSGKGWSGFFARTSVMDGWRPLMCDGFDVGGWMFWVFHVAAMELRSGRTRGESHSTPDDNVKNKFDMFSQRQLAPVYRVPLPRATFLGKLTPFVQPRHPMWWSRNASSRGKRASEDVVLDSVVSGPRVREGTKPDQAQPNRLACQNTRHPVHHQEYTVTKPDAPIERETRRREASRKALGAL